MKQVRAIRPTSSQKRTLRVPPPPAQKRIDGPSTFRDLWLPIIVVFGIFLAATVIWWTMIRADTTPHKASLGTLVYGWDSWPGTLPMLIAKERGYFEDYGLQVVMKEEESNSAMLSDLADGSIDIASDITANDAVLQTSKGRPWQIVAVEDASIGGDGIVSRQDIASVRNLKGKRVAAEKGTFEELLLYAALKAEGLSLKDVTIVDLGAHDAAAAFIRQEVDAAVAYEPALSQAVDEGNGRLLFTTADAPNLILDTVVVRQPVIDAAPEKITAALRAFFDGVAFLKDHPTEAYAIGAQYFRMPAADVATYVRRMHLFDLADNVQAMSHFAGTASLYSSLIESDSYLRESGLMTTGSYPDALITPNFIQDLWRTHETQNAATS
jgi:NitT/TauT family transport system substrate-binding protein